METIIISALAQYVIPVVGAALVGLASWGLAILKGKVKIEAGKAALDQVDRIVGTVVGNISQTVAKDMKAAAADGHLSQKEKHELRRSALVQAKRLISQEVANVAKRAVPSIDEYIGKKIEEQVLRQKQ